jgi:hypothetical protein
METEIPNARLTAQDVPESAEALEAVTRFALSFDGYAYWGERCGERANAAAAAFQESGSVPGDLAELRACLFYEQARLQWTEELPDPGWTGWVQALLDAIRAGASA